MAQSFLGSSPQSQQRDHQFVEPTEVTDEQAPRRELEEIQQVEDEYHFQIQGESYNSFYRHEYSIETGIEESLQNLKTCELVMKYSYFKEAACTAQNDVRKNSNSSDEHDISYGTPTFASNLRNLSLENYHHITSLDDDPFKYQTEAKKDSEALVHKAHSLPVYNK